MSANVLESRVKKWLTDSGYPLEMKVATAFQRGGFRVYQSDSYKDPETGDIREIDVFAMDDHETKDFVVRVHFLIECKVSIDRPWILFLSHSHHLAMPASVSQRASNGLGRVFLRRICQLDEAQSIPLFSNLRQPIAYGMTEAFGKDGNSICYKAIMSAKNAAEASAKETSGRIPFDNYLNVFIPVVVVDGHLFHSILDVGSNEPTVSQIEQGQLVLRAPSLGMPHTFVNVVSYTAVDDFVAMCKESCDLLFSVADKQSEKIVAAIKRHEDYVEP